MVKVENKMIKVENEIDFNTEIQNFLNKFCIQDRRAITKGVHKEMMLAHFYYVDIYGQGWYVLDDDALFHRKPNGEEYYVYGTLWSDATAWE